MYRFYINGIENEYHFGELARLFLDDGEFEVIPVTAFPGMAALLGRDSRVLNEDGSLSRESIKRQMYGILEEITGTTQPWGTLTGVRPLKLAFQVYDQEKSKGISTGECLRETRRRMGGEYLLSPEKLDLLMDILSYQLENVAPPDPATDSLYVGIPFCPTRCSYCAFASNVASQDDIERYLGDLLKEIDFMGDIYSRQHRRLESVYIGGGTPTTLDPEQLTRLIEAIYSSFDITPGSIEFTVEAGRPDTITKEKITALRDLMVDRISINPQTMKDHTLELMGRSHDAEQIREAFRITEGSGFTTVNSDLIAGLPEENVSDFTESLRQVIALGAENITVHTLSVKHGSRLRAQDPDYYRKRGDVAGEMLREGGRILYSAGYRPYYIYRQKHQMGGLENVGWCRPGHHSLYNIRIMEEKQTVIALGAGAIGKVYYPERDGLERIANVSNYRIYSERFPEILRRKNEYFGTASDPE